MAEKAITFDLDGTLLDLRAVYVRAHQLAAAEVLEMELEEERVLELMGTGMPIRQHMALLDENSADRTPVAVVTSKLRDDALAELAVTALDAQIDALVAFEDTSKHKPHPDPISRRSLP